MGREDVRYGDACLALFVLAIAIALVIPLPTLLLDVLITANLGFSFLLLLVCLYVPNALAFLTFPSILLLSTLLRLSLNVASCRLILSSGDAGQVIHSFGTFLIQGEVVVGFIIFSIITAVNVIVISRGAGRVSEVAARFALEGLPGTQSAIDSDLRSGLLTPEQAHQRREELRQESQLYGAMDGAMRFVQGDSVAGIVIIGANLLGGLFLGMSRGLDLPAAIQQYSVLTVGDGLVSQIPALITAICAGLLVTRVDGRSTRPLSGQLVDQMLGRPIMVTASGGLLLGLATLPGLPALPFALVGGFFVTYGLGVSWGGRRRRVEVPAEGTVIGMLRGSTAGKEREFFAEGNRVVRVFFDSQMLGPAFREKENFYLQRWAQCSLDVSQSFGIRLPRLIMEEDASLESGQYRVSIRGDELFRGRLNPANMLVELGIENGELFGFIVSQEVEHPTSGKMVFWSPAVGRTLNLAQAGNIRLLDAVEFLFLKMISFFRHHPEEVLGILDMHLMIKELDRRFPGTIEDALRRHVIDVARLTELMHELTREGLDISEFQLLIEQVLAYCSSYRALLSDGAGLDVGHATAFIRVQRRRALTARVLTGQRSLRAFVLSREVEELFEQLPLESGSLPLSVPAQISDTLRDGLNRLVEPVRRFGVPRVCFVCRPDLRGRVGRFLRSAGHRYDAISFDELDPSIPVEQIAAWEAGR